jgi:recombination protein RecA
LFNEGIHKVGDVFDLAVKRKLIEKNGNTFSYGSEKLGVGLDRAKTKLEENKELLAEITTKLRETLWQQ